MKKGRRPIIVECAVVPEHPEYWSVPDSAAAAIELLVADGMVEYEPAFARADGGQFAPPAAAVAAVVVTPPPPAGARPFSRRGGR